MKASITLAIALALSTEPILAVEQDDKIAPIENLQYYKANIIDPVRVPRTAECDSIHQCEDEMVSGYLARRVVMTGQKGFDWRGPYIEFIDVRTLQKAKIHQGDTFKVIFYDNTSVIVSFDMSQTAGLWFKVVHGTQRLADGTLIANRNPSISGGYYNYVQPQQHVYFSPYSGAAYIPSDADLCTSGVVRYCPVSKGG